MQQIELVEIVVKEAPCSQTNTINGIHYLVEMFTDTETDTDVWLTVSHQNLCRAALMMPTRFSLSISGTQVVGAANWIIKWNIHLTKFGI